MNLGFRIIKEKSLLIMEPDTPELYFDLNTFTYNIQYHLPDNSKWKTTIGLSVCSKAIPTKQKKCSSGYHLFDAGVYCTQRNYDRFTSAVVYGSITGYRL